MQPPPSATPSPIASVWHALDGESVLDELAATADGLEPAEAAARLERWGPNRPVSPRAEPAWRILARQFASVVVVLLLVAATLALAMREWANAAAIGAVLLLDVALGFTTEWRARRAIEALLALQAPRATIRRGGHRLEVDAAGVVPGDLLILEAGMTVPADARLLQAAELQLVESLLTGESVGVVKRSAPPAAAEAPLAERVTMVYAGTSVADGSGRAIVVETGPRTELGRVGTLVAGVMPERSPLELRLDALGRNLGAVAVAVAALVGGVAFSHGVALPDVVTLVIAVAVAAIPEGLPAVVTIAMAVGAQRMARRRAIVRRLPAVESLGAVSIVCTDKTGTLTLGEMTVTTLWAGDTEYQVSGVGYGAEGEVRSAGTVRRVRGDAPLAALLTVAALANRASLRGEGAQRAAIGDPTEAALLVAAEKGGLDRAALLRRLPELAELPFSSARMLMATVHGEQGPSVRLLVKGAPLRVLERCAMDDDERRRLLSVNEELAGRGLRVLAFAHAVRDGPAAPACAAAWDAALDGLTFLGFAGMSDPPAPHVRETIVALRRAGIRTLMLTGDQRATADAVGRALGVVTGELAVLDGAALDAAGDSALRERLAPVGAISRVSPEGKLRVVRALRAAGHIVAMLGDGVNDAPALRQADVGVTMGRRGTDVAREAAGVVLADDRFETIAAAVEEGRRIFDNIRRVVLYLLAGNLAELIVILGGAITGAMLLTPLQILWINLVTDSLPALALAVEPAAADVMRRPPRLSGEPLLPRRLVVLAVIYAVVVAAVTYAAFVLGGGAERGRAAAFITVVLAQLVLVVWLRAPRRRGMPAREGRGYTGLAVSATLALQAALFLIPGVAGALGLRSLGAAGVLMVATLAMATGAAVAGLRRLHDRSAPSGDA